MTEILLTGILSLNPITWEMHVVQGFVFCGLFLEEKKCFQKCRNVVISICICTKMYINYQGLSLHRVCVERL